MSVNSSHAYRYPALGDRAVVLNDTGVGNRRGLVVGISTALGGGVPEGAAVDLLLDGGGSGRFRMGSLAEEGDWEAWVRGPRAAWVGR